MVSRQLSSTYQSFADTGPTYSYLDLSRARSDESLAWGAGEEAAALVAQLRASLASPLMHPQDEDDDDPLPHHDPHAFLEEQLARRIRHPPGPLARSLSFTHLSAEDLCHPPSLGPPPHSPSDSSSSSSTSSSTSAGASTTLLIRGVGGGGVKRPVLRTFGGSWRSLLKMGGMSARVKAGSGVKKVAPPTVPDTGPPTHHPPTTHRHVAVEDNQPPSPRSPGRGDQGRGGSTVGGHMGNTSPSHYHTPHFAFPPAPPQVPQFAHLMCAKTSPGSPHHLPPETPYPPYLTYHQQGSMEDQGIDVQSPGRSSPGSGSGSSTTGSTASSTGCRNSTTSLDSGRASTTTHSTHQHRLSGQSYDSGSILRHSYHSSTSSLGSLEHDPPPPHLNIHELINNGVRDCEVLRVWLGDLRLEEHYDKFVTAGYDMPTITRMTPEDLNAIGITKPAHRKKLKAEITKLTISDGLPDYIPGRLEEWLGLLGLEEYLTCLRRQQVTTVDQMTQLTWEDLEDIGITKLGHQKKVVLAIKRLKDLMAGKKFPSSGEAPPRPPPHYGPQEVLITREPGDFTPAPEFRTFSGPGPYPPQDHTRLGGPTDHYGPPHYPQCGPGPPPPQAHVLPMTHHFHHPHGPTPPGPRMAPGPPHPGGVQYHPDVVAVQVRGGGRGVEEPIYGTYHTFHPDTRMAPLPLSSLPPRPFHPPHPHPHPGRSMDDGDITPTNDYTHGYEGGGGTLPRPRAGPKLRPVAKVTAKTRVDVHLAPTSAPPLPDLSCLKKGPSSSSSSTPTPTPTPQGTPKKVPPPPPKRSNSISECSGVEGSYRCLQRGLSYGYMGIKNNLQPDVTPDLPPPPAPPDSANHQHLPDDFPPPPPPLTCVTMASATRIPPTPPTQTSPSVPPSSTTTSTTTTSTSSIASTTSTTSTSSTSSSSDDEVPPGFRPRRNDSNASFKSTSSTDSESLPFANENAGTIKQRTGRPPHPSLALDPRSSPSASPRASPAPRRKDLPPLLPSQTPPPPPPPQPQAITQINATDVSTPEGSDVLSDIGTMLANLTDELDAMLEQEATPRD